MKPDNWGKFPLLTAAFLFLAACQPVMLGVKNPPALTADATGSAEPIASPSAVPQAAPTGQGLTGGNLPACWQVFKHAARGYSLTYPLVWVNNQVSQYSQEFNEIQVEPAGMGPPLRLYVSVYPKDYTNQDPDVSHFVYHFVPLETIREFMALPVGESMLKDPDTPTPDSDTYTRLPDRIVAGETALVIENSKVWEAPTGTKDRIALIEIKGTLYLLGMYYETPEQLAMFEQVLDSFQLIPSDLEGHCCSHT